MLFARGKLSSGFVFQSLEARNFCSAGTVFSSPIVITKGGTYRGAWRSDDAEVAAVRVRTTEPVVIENSIIESRGNLIESARDHINLTVVNTVGYGVNPNAVGQAAGRFVEAENFSSVVIENNDLTGTTGILLDRFAGRPSQHNTIKVIGNVAENIDGRKSDGHGGYEDFNTRISRTDGHVEEGFELVQFVQIAHVQAVPRVQIAWNQVTNASGQSRVEDNISIYRSSGTPQSPIAIHDNYIDGAYTIKPPQHNDRDKQWIYDWGYSGGGIMLGDGGSDSLESACGYVQAYDNQVLNTTNYGIAITAGHDETFWGNRIVSTGQTSHGNWIAAQNVGASIWDANGNAKGVHPTFFNNGAHNNLIGWAVAKVRNDWWNPDAASWKHNDHYPGALSAAAIAREQAIWKRKRKTAHAVIGA